jgi:hypothetical protein
MLYWIGFLARGMKRKWIFRLVLGVGVVLLVVFVSVAFSLGSIIKTGVEGIGPRATRVDVKLKHAEVWLLAWRVQLSGIVVGNPPGYRTPSSFEVGDVVVRFKPGSVFSDKLVVESIKVKAPVITWEGGLRDNNLKQIENNLNDFIGSSSTARTSAAPSSSAAKQERKLQVNELEIFGAKVQIKTALSGGRAIVLAIPDIHLTGLGSGPGGITPVEVGQRALHAVLIASTEEVAKNAGKLGTEALSGSKGVIQKATESIKGLLQSGH